MWAGSWLNQTHRLSPWPAVWPGITGPSSRSSCMALAYGLTSGPASRGSRPPTQIGPPKVLHGYEPGVAQCPHHLGEGCRGRGGGEEGRSARNEMRKSARVPPAGDLRTHILILGKTLLAE